MDQQLKDLCIKVEAGASLDACLAKYTKPQLKAIVEILGGKIASSAKKQEMADKAEEIIKASVVEYFEGDGAKHKAMMNSMCTASVAQELPGTAAFEQVKDLYDRGYIYLYADGDKARAFVPENIKAIFTAVDNPAAKSQAPAAAPQPESHPVEIKSADMNRTERETALLRYATSLAAIYGVYPATQLKEIWDFNNARSVGPTELRDILVKAGAEDGFYIDGQYIVSLMLPDADAYCAVLEKHDRYDIYYYPDDSEIEKYTEGPIITTDPEYAFVRSFLARNMGVEDMDQMDDIMTELYLLCTTDSAPATVVDFVRSQGVDFGDDLEKFNLFISLYTVWFYSIRAWACKGYKPLELKYEKLVNRNFKMPMDADPAVFRKAGRNDKCPCGSGRKYKGCCMKYTR